VTKARQKLWRPAETWVPSEWATSKEAWLRVYESLKEDMILTRRDVKADLLAGRLVGAARVFAPDGTERCIIFDPAFWEPVELPYAWSVAGWDKHYRKGERWRFFVRRHELDQRYPAASAAPAVGGQQEQQAGPPQPVKVKLHRPPGPPPEKDWPLRIAVEYGRRLERGEEPTAPQMCEWALKNLNLIIDDGDMRAGDEARQEVTSTISHDLSLLCFLCPCDCPRVSITREDNERCPSLHQSDAPVKRVDNSHKKNASAVS
jgi:hypothetical protein